MGLPFACRVRSIISLRNQLQYSTLDLLYNLTLADTLKWTGSQNTLQISVSSPGVLNEIILVGQMSEDFFEIPQQAST